MTIPLSKVMSNCQTIRATARGQCLATCRRALEQNSTGNPSAAAFARMTQSNGKLRTGFDAPAGAVYLWTGGSAGYGHITIAAGGRKTYTTDGKNAPRMTLVDVEALNRSWSNLNYVGWSEYYGAHKLDTGGDGTGAVAAASTSTSTSAPGTSEATPVTDESAGSMGMLTKALNTITDTTMMLRAVQVLGGAILVILGLIVLAKPAATKIVKGIQSV